MLRVNNLFASYHKALALRGVDVQVPAGSIVSVIGANGAGKSSLVNSIMGIVAEVKGSIDFDGTELAGLPTHARVRAGVTLVPEGRRIFAPKTVWENLELGAYSVTGRKRSAIIAARVDEVYQLFPRLKERHDQIAGTMSGGEQQMLAIGRALMSAPRLLLLDEPSLGLAPLIVDQILGALDTLNKEQGMTILLIEQNAAAALRHSSSAFVLETGRVVLSGPASVLANDPAVKRAYLRIGVDANEPEVVPVARRGASS